MNKKAQGLPISTIILIILGIVVLVAIVLGFSMGWEKIIPWLKSDNNVDVVVSQCRVACTTRNTYDFCTAKRNIIIEGNEIEASCKEYSQNPGYEKYGIAECTNLCV
jgi:hypothetical protein